MGGRTGRLYQTAEELSGVHVSGEGGQRMGKESMLEDDDEIELDDLENTNDV